MMKPKAYMTVGLMIVKDKKTTPGCDSTLFLIVCSIAEVRGHASRQHGPGDLLTAL